jgi:hypothetical protein
MNTPFDFAADETASALVIVFPPGVRGLFNSDIHDLVRDVQEQLDGVYVTYALSSGASPDLRAAIAGAHFVGCQSAVVIPAETSDVAQLSDHRTTGDWLLNISPVDSELDAPAVVNAYLTAVAEAGKAA